MKIARGILICGTGIGVSIAATKFRELMQHWLTMYIRLREHSSVTMPILSHLVHRLQELSSQNAS